MLWLQALRRSAAREREGRSRAYEEAPGVHARRWNAARSIWGHLGVNLGHPGVNLHRATWAKLEAAIVPLIVAQGRTRTPPVPSSAQRGIKLRESERETLQLL